MRKEKVLDCFAASAPPKLLRFVSAANDILERPAVDFVVRASCVCYQQDRAGRRIRENPCEQTPHRAVPALASNHTSYGQNASFAKPKLTEKIGKDSWAKSFREIPVEKADACGAAMGRRDDAQNVRRGKDRPAAFTTYHGTFTST